MTASDEFNQALEHLLESRAREAWQDGHDTALTITFKRLRKLHAPQLIFSDVYCSHCLETVNYETDQAPYPCATIQIIDKHLREPR